MGTAASNVYLNSDDLNDFAEQTLQNVVASEYEDKNYINNENDRMNLQDLIKQALVADEEVVSSADDHRWSSVFWDKEWARPDLLTHFLNDKFKMNAGGARNFSFGNNDTLQYEEQHSSSQGSSGGSLGISIGPFSLGGSGSHSSSGSHGSTSVDKDNRTISTVDK